MKVYTEGQNFSKWHLSLSTHCRFNKVIFMSSAYSQLKINHCKNGMNFRTRLTCSSISQTVTTLIYSHILSEGYLTAANLVQLAISIRYYVYTGSQYFVRLNSLRWITADHTIHLLLKTSTPTGRTEILSPKHLDYKCMPLYLLKKAFTSNSFKIFFQIQYKIIIFEGSYFHVEQCAVTENCIILNSL